MLEQMGSQFDCSQEHKSGMIRTRCVCVCVCVCVCASVFTIASYYIR